MQRHPLNVAPHVWTFFRAGGLAQVALDSPEDLLALPSLDQKLWVALSCPTKGIALDARTLELLDGDHDGFIRVPEVLAAVEWACARLKHPADLLKAEASLPLAAINDGTPDGAVLIAAAGEILKRLGKPDTTAITPEDFAEPAKIFPATALNGDGVLTPGETDDPELQQLVKDILACGGGAPDRSGAEGVSAAKAAEFFAQVDAYLAWLQKSADKDIAVLGEHTAAACAALAKVRPKVEDYFARCRLAAFDVRATAALNRQETEFLAIAAKDLTITSDEIAGLPLARVAADAVLPLYEGCNPAWADRLALLHREAVAPLFGPEKRVLTAEDWRVLNAKLAPYELWVGRKAGANVEPLGIERLRQLAGAELRGKLARLFEAEKALQPQFQAISSVERLAHYYRDLRTLLRNFVNFADFYSRDRWAVFQVGKLYLDLRACELCVRVDDPGAHAALATMSKGYLAYLDCRRQGQVLKIVAVFTQGDSDYLFVGRNGVFYDRQGADWQATITKIVENPISLREAFWSPYKKVIRAIEGAVAKRAAAADTASVTKLSAAATAAPAAPPPAPGAAPARKLDLTSIIGLSVAIGSVGTFLATLFAKFVDLPWWQVPLVIIVLMLVVSLPSMLIAWLKLRQRNLGPILEANGWAINGRVKINVPFGTALTERAHLPARSRVRAGDPYSGGHPIRSRVILYATLLALAVATLLFARAQGTWPFKAPPPERQDIKVAK